MTNTPFLFKKFNWVKIFRYFKFLARGYCLVVHWQWIKTILCRIEECHNVLKELNYAAREMDNLHGRALFFCNCFDLILETGVVLFCLLLLNNYLLSKLLLNFRSHSGKRGRLYNIHNSNFRRSSSYLGFDCKILSQCFLASLVRKYKFYVKE